MVWEVSMIFLIVIVIVILCKILGTLGQIANILIDLRDGC